MDPSLFRFLDFCGMRTGLSYLWLFSACWATVEAWVGHLSSFWWPLQLHYGSWGFLCPRSLQQGSSWTWSLPGYAVAGATSPPPPRSLHQGVPAERTSREPRTVCVVIRTVLEKMKSHALWIWSVWFKKQQKKHFVTLRGALLHMSLIFSKLVLLKICLQCRYKTL